MKCDQHLGLVEIEGGNQFLRRGDFAIAVSLVHIPFGLHLGFPLLAVTAAVAVGC